MSLGLSLDFNWMLNFGPCSLSSISMGGLCADAWAAWPAYMHNGPGMTFYALNETYLVTGLGYLGSFFFFL